ncbi:glycoside hydrolase family 15 protein [Ramlibacter sp. AW1]|uniref:Trehalase n=1 Tax=Ramlibacter aurantiacus TaxID=2801330 RepID=A0A936ZNN3_9BURK|nr:glycoside hydrolase family 15 protein [Ramlibacter aurantiacus]MBL0420670.1 glycoside hydrolase family 15 protein [Ramlibacter aurantiacus]
MNKHIEDYGFIGNMMSGALVARDGSIDWLCLPHFDSHACFAALLGTPAHGHWQIRPADPVLRTTRRYQPGTAILETRFETASGACTLIDCMPFSDNEREVDVLRVVRGETGRVALCMELVIRFDYGQIVPWVRHRDYGLSAVAGPDALQLFSPVDLVGRDMTTVAEFTVSAGEHLPFTLAYHPSHWPERPLQNCEERVAQTARRWRDWSCRCEFALPEGHAWHDAVSRSLITLKALTFQPTAGIVAALTTSLPERLGGVRNWDYRYCWLRDSTLVLQALLASGYRDEAHAWRQWLLRAVAGDPRQLQIMYGIRGERRLTEVELPWLPGYAESRPVRVGNAAYGQRQLDVPGELLDTLHVGRKFNLERNEDAWSLQRTILKQLEQDWNKTDEGIWEVRGGQKHFTHSRLMCWTAFDRGVKAVEEFGLDGPVERWREVRARIHADICTHGWNPDKRSFVQFYGGTSLDASLLLMAQVGFLSADDPRFIDTVAAIERELMQDGLVLRYRPADTPDGLPGDEGAFLACSFWLVDAYVMMGRRDEALALFEHLLALRNDLGLLAEEYDATLGRQLGNFPQAFSHIALVNAAHNLASSHGPAPQRAEHTVADPGSHAGSSAPQPLKVPAARRPG